MWGKCLKYHHVFVLKINLYIMIYTLYLDLPSTEIIYTHSIPVQATTLLT